MALRACLKHGTRLPRLVSINSKRSLFRANDQHSGKEENPLTGVEVSTEEFKYVEKLMPDLVVPQPPKHDKYPTPSGWIPPSEKGLTHPYFVERTRFHNLPVYLQDHLCGGTRKITLICRVKGDHWKFEADLRDFMSKRTDRKVYTQVNEVREQVRLRGIYLDDVCQFLLEKGF